MAQKDREPATVIEDAADAIARIDALAGTHLIALAAAVLLPLWCRESLACDATRTGRSVASVAAWGLAWPLAMVVALMVPVV